MKKVKLSKRKNPSNPGQGNKFAAFLVKGGPVPARFKVKSSRKK